MESKELYYLIMTQVVSNKTGREKIVKASGENTEIKIIAKNFNDYIEVRTELKLDPEHKFSKDCQISIQPYESKGFAKSPMDMGTVGEASDLVFNLDDISIDTLLFRIKVVDKNNIVKGFADEIRPDFSGGTGTSEGGDGSNTILPIKEDSSLKLPFAVQMEPGSKPVLLVKSKLNLKEQFKHDIKTKVFIYTSIIRQILTNYLSDKNYDDCTKKNLFLNKVLGNAGLDIELSEIPEYFNEDLTVNQEAVEWIELTTAACIDTPVIFKGLKTNYLSLFEQKCKEQAIEEDNEN
jgi:hypothetical protein